MKRCLLVMWGSVGLSMPAHAEYPNDVSLDHLLSYSEQDLATDKRTAIYQQVVQELAIMVANKPLAPAETLGLNGFDVALTSTLGLVDGSSASETSVSSWGRMHETESSDPIVWIPGIVARKGLPLSLEMGFNFGYMAYSRQGRVGGFGRWGLVEGYRQYPDIAIQFGYSAYIGNDQLELGVADSSVIIGKSFPFGRLVGINTALLSPYAGVGLLKITATPYLSETEQEDLGISALSANKANPAFAEGFSPLDIHLGLRILSGDVQVFFAATLAPKLLVPTVSAGIGYSF